MTRLLRFAYLLAVGWYLITPDAGLDARGGVTVSHEQPLGKWRMQRAYDSAGQCEAARALWRKQQIELLDAMYEAPPSIFVELDRSTALTMKATDAMRAVFARCIPSDDPRLKEPR